MNSTAVLAATPVQLGALLLLLLAPILIMVTWLIVRCTRRISEEAEAIVRSAEESHIVSFLQSNGPAIIRRLGTTPAGGAPTAGRTIELTENGEYELLPHPEQEEGDAFGRSGTTEELQTVIVMEEPSSHPSLSGEFKPLGS
jgi:hypothetical protein